MRSRAADRLLWLFIVGASLVLRSTGTDAPGQTSNDSLWFQTSASNEEPGQHEHAGLVHPRSAAAIPRSPCSLGHYMGAVELCQVAARRQRLQASSDVGTGALGPPRVVTPAGIPDLLMDEMLHPLWSSPRQHTTQGTECQDHWYY
eukprot:COSAG06_NODE_25688_length_631_cov_0.610902_1_plen_145_part_10